MPTTVTEEKVDAIEESGNRWQGTTSGRKISRKYPANRLTKKKKKKAISEFHMILKDAHLLRDKMDGPVMKTTAV